ncbi:uncharacterized protein NECHADRAFT_87965 [Fusarium vanettenii 77-13-4]|uniref:Uncharacterized protein n=1 Tax=Fusarium vanettenii (strain ATCC MYA-4622 / CBS 123669 / FGSC 9596 / NRRL 45880 / 77-13-4) TaxID=660122 RepID=C7ZJX2_FUSV7|nr:uncharacterized protein NECHADRAFT_87965 [Fusarium vanettenii 77-13-4]EEU35707.1 predicted protein [Fusarium vanettenii 77-13-4]
MRYLFTLVSLLACALASPTPSHALSIFDDDTIPVVDQPDLEHFNVTRLSGHYIDTKASSIEKRALKLDYVLYDVAFDGRNEGNLVPFRVTGQLLVIKRIPVVNSPNGANPVDVVIKIGNPAGNPVAGSIHYVTNRYLNPFLGGIRDGSRTDFARVSVKSDTIKVSADTAFSLINALSVFNARSGFFADVYNAYSGGFTLTVKNGKMTGRVGFVGKQVISGASPLYRARIGGKAKQKGRITL